MPDDTIDPVIIDLARDLADSERAIDRIEGMGNSPWVAIEWGHARALLRRLRRAEAAAEAAQRTQEAA